MACLKIVTDTADLECLTHELTSSSILARAAAVERLSEVMRYPTLNADSHSRRISIPQV